MLKTEDKTSKLDEAIDRLLIHMQYAEPESDEYGTLVGRLDKLHSMKISDKNDKKRVSADAILTAGASILGILLIIGHERVNVVTSKALGFVVKQKL